jgi:hypothetical protein
MQPTTTATGEGIAPHIIKINGKDVTLSEPFEAMHSKHKPLIEALNVILPKLGEDFYRYTYDLSVHLVVALDKAGYRIVSKPNRVEAIRFGK